MMFWSQQMAGARANPSPFREREKKDESGGASTLTQPPP